MLPLVRIEPRGDRELEMTTAFEVDGAVPGAAVDVVAAAPRDARVGEPPPQPAARTATASPPRPRVGPRRENGNRDKAYRLPSACTMTGYTGQATGWFGVNPTNPRKGWAGSEPISGPGRTADGDW